MSKSTKGISIRNPKSRGFFRKVNLARLASWFLLTIGLIALSISAVYTNYFLAFIGLGLTFWGALLLYLSPEKYVKKTLLFHTVVPLLKGLNQILTELEYSGYAVYLPPNYFTNHRFVKVLIPKNDNIVFTIPQKIQLQAEKIFLEIPCVALITPPGLSLAELFEKRLKTDFSNVTLEYLKQSLPRLFVEDLEIAQGFEFIIENNKICVKMEKSVFNAMHLETKELLGNYMLGCPLSSALACVLTKATCSPIIIEKQQISNGGRDLAIKYRLLNAEGQIDL
ncbi:MAG: hypothetical protein NWE94_05810 [Candidatus Bathyarchaeota archaeon]|nr:hypothetical protein [Candidatus Bathyarchaeota archaeon]